MNSKAYKQVFISAVKILSVKKVSFKSSLSTIFVLQGLDDVSLAKYLTLGRIFHCEAGNVPTVFSQVRNGAGQSYFVLFRLT